MKTKSPICPILVLTVLAALWPARHALGQGTAFRYQGALSDGGTPAHGSYDFQFALFDASAAGNEIAGPVAALATPVSNGLFSVTIDFGSSSFTDGKTLWLEVATRTNGAASFTTLAARQQITPVPYAIYAPQAGSAVTAATAADASAVAASNIVGALTPSQLPAGTLTNGAANVTLNGDFVGGGAGLTNITIPLSSLDSQGTLSLTTNQLGFSLFATLNFPAAPFVVITADVNGDGHPDIVTANPDGSLTVQTNDGHGHFTQASAPVLPDGFPRSLATADFNGDGKPDLACVTGQHNMLAILTNAGTGQFALFATLSGFGNPSCVLATNLNGDAAPDLVVANASSNSLTILLNQGGGVFQNSTVKVGPAPTSVAAADINHDGKVDLITANFSNDTLTVLTNDGSGHFSTNATLPSAGAQFVLAIDINGDGFPDLITQAGSFINDGNGSFAAGPAILPDVAVTALATADVNGDGRPDLLVGDALNSLTLDVLTNNGAGSFSSAAVLPFYNEGPALAAADLNGDGKTDIAALDGQVLFLWTNGATAVSPELTPAIQGGGLRFVSDAFAIDVIDGAPGNTVDSGAHGSVIAGGGLAGADHISANDSVISGGSINSIQIGAGDSVIGGGFNNVIGSADSSSVIAGGQGNQITGYSGVIGGGVNNTASGLDTVSGGTDNQAIGGDSAVAGGGNNVATGYASAIGGGADNQATEQAGVVAGGWQNEAGGQEAAVGGGYQNSANASYATVPGGYQNIAAGVGSFAAGSQAQAFAQGAFVWSDTSFGGFSSSTPDSFDVQANGGVLFNSRAGLTLNGACVIHPSALNPYSDTLTVNGVARVIGNNLYFTASPNTNSGIGYFDGAKSFADSNAVDGPVLFGQTSGILGTQTNGSQHIAVQWDASSVTVYGTFNNSSDRNAKQDFAPVSSAEILDKVAHLPLSEWSYKSDAAVRHIGPMGQDFHSVFHIGTDEKHIAPIDEGGVALAAIQGLNQKLQDESKAKDAQIAQLRQSVAELKAMVLQLTIAGQQRN